MGTVKCTGETALSTKDSGKRAFKTGMENCRSQGRKLKKEILNTICTKIKMCRRSLNRLLRFNNRWKRALDKIKVIVERKISKKAIVTIEQKIRLMFKATG